MVISLAGIKVTCPQGQVRHINNLIIHYCSDSSIKSNHISSYNFIFHIIILYDMKCANKIIKTVAVFLFLICYFSLEWDWLTLEGLRRVDKAFIFSMFWFICSFDHQLKRGLEYLCKRYISSNDSTKGDPRVSGNQRDKTAAINVVDPNMIKGSSLNVTSGK